jgi:hypothetical protein
MGGSAEARTPTTPSISAGGRPVKQKPRSPRRVGARVSVICRSIPCTQCQTLLQIRTWSGATKPRSCFVRNKRRGNYLVSISPVPSAATAEHSLVAFGRGRLRVQPSA